MGSALLLVLVSSFLPPQFRTPRSPCNNNILVMAVFRFIHAPITFLYGGAISALCSLFIFGQLFTRSIIINIILPDRHVYDRFRHTAFLEIWPQSTVTPKISIAR